eukprot:9546544-Ditylum_brightwellii.AAC.1
MEAHVHGLRSFWDHTSCGEVVGGVVVGDQGGRGLQMAHLLKHNFGGGLLCGRYRTRSPILPQTQMLQHVG